MTEGLIGPQAQQYMHDVTPGVGTVGYLPLLEWVRGHIAEQHAPPYQGWECCVCTGNADGRPDGKRRSGRRGASLHASSCEQASSARGRRCSIQATSCCCGPVC